jgi:hypothetical protein
MGWEHLSPIEASPEERLETFYEVVLFFFFFHLLLCTCTLFFACIWIGGLISLTSLSLVLRSFRSFVRATVAQRTEMLFGISEDRHRNEKNNCQGEPGAAEGTGGLASGEGVGCCHEMRCYGYSMSAF